MPAPGRRLQRRPGAVAGRRRAPAAAAPHPPAGDAGMVTAETAMALPTLLVVLAVALWALGAVGAQLRCTDAAAGAARAAARGDDPAAVAAVAGRLAPAGAHVAVSVRGDDVEVVVTVRVRPVALPGRLGAVDVRGRAVAAREPGDPTRLEQP